MKEFILHIHDWLSARKGVAAAVLAVVLGLCLVSALRLHLQEDISAFLPAEQRDELSRTEGQEQVVLFFRGGTLEDRLDAIFAFEDAWNLSCPEIPLQAQASQEQALQVMDFLSGNWPYFLEEGDYARMDSLLSVPGYIPGRLAQMKTALYGGNALQTRYFRADPLDLFSPVLGRLQSAQPENRLEEGCLFTPDGETGIVFLESPYGGSESGANASLVAQLAKVKAEIREAFPQIEITSTGAPEVAVENARRIKRDSFLSLAIAAILICIVLWLSYKRVADVLWILLSIAAGALFALGLIGLVKTSLSLIVLGIGCTVIGIAVNYPLHYVDHLKYQPHRRRALAEQVNPLLVGNITTVGAFLGLLLMKAEALRDFGLIGALMLVGTILFVLFFLPVFVPPARRERNTLKLDLDRYLPEGKRHSRFFFILFLLLTAVFLYTGIKVGFDTNLHHINYMTKEQEEGFALLEGLRPDASAFPLPCMEEQQERLSRWEAFLRQHPSLEAELGTAAAEEGFTPSAFEPFLKTLQTAWQPQPRAHFQPVDFAPDTSAAQALVGSLSTDFDTIGLVCGLIVFVFLWLSFGRLELTLLAFLPLAVSWVWIQGIMGLTGLQFNVVNVILATFIFGMGDDYSIFITEGLLYERATGQKILHSYKNAVVLSALIMFIGIGVLAFAKHPALRSLGLVTVIGMITVVALSCYLPPLVFRWLTTHRNGEPRKAPLTLGSGLRTLFIGLMMVVWMTLLSLLTLFVPKGLFFHKVIRRVASWAIRCVPGCPYTLVNPHGEDFLRPAVYVCNHQSHLDVLALIALQPKLIFMTNDWVWKFPFYGAVIRKAGYFPASWGLSKNSAHVRKLVAEGYSIVIFPEGTRTLDGSIQRFHRGAFLTAQELGLDVLPLCLHGFHYALPKHDFLLRKAGLSLEVGERVQVEGDVVEFTRKMRHFYQEWYASVCRDRETAAYLAPLVRLEYLYKGHEAQAECRRTLRKDVFERIDALEGPSLEIREAGCGVEALLTARVHPAMQVTAHEADKDKYLTATRCRVPDNLTFVHD